MLSSNCLSNEMIFTLSLIVVIVVVIQDSAQVREQCIAELLYSNMSYRKQIKHLPHYYLQNWPIITSSHLE